jgi:hypothetical protein
VDVAEKPTERSIAIRSRAKDEARNEKRIVRVAENNTVENPNSDKCSLKTHPIAREKN